MKVRASTGDVDVREDIVVREDVDVRGDVDGTADIGVRGGCARSGGGQS